MVALGEAHLRPNGNSVLALAPADVRLDPVYTLLVAAADFLKGQGKTVKRQWKVEER